MLEERFLADIRYIAGVGQPQQLRAFDGGAYRGMVPEALLVIWQRFGIASWADGACQTCDPQSIASAMETALDGLLDHRECVPFVVSAFGFVKAWHRCYGVFDISFPQGSIILSKAPEALEADPPGDINLIARFPTRSEDLPAIPGFASVRRRLGRLGENEVYGFAPALALGGSAAPATAERCAADIHLDLLAQMQPFALSHFTPSGYRRLK